ncbi:hypothetical protein L0Y69_02850 [bacterium]|nr:hypothetical protein [bacterium]
MKNNLNALRERNKVTVRVNKRQAKVDLAKKILKGVAVAGALAGVLVLPGAAPLLKLFGAETARGRYRMKRTLASLEKRKLLRVERQNGKTTVTLTESGKTRVLEYDFEEMKIVRPKKWDGKWHIISFDIPEPKRKARRNLSIKLRGIGCYPLQESLFISPYSCREEIDFLGEIAQVRKYIFYLVAEKIENEEFLKRFFSL